MTHGITSPETISRFRCAVMDHYRENGRDLPWRNTRDPYAVLVSELMLQQTQVDRVIPKFLAFMDDFPTVAALAGANIGNVLIRWQGLGYNRRAKYLFDAAKCIMTDHGGTVPDSVDALKTLPGIGPYTAAAVVAFAFNKPAVVLDTNIRRVFIHEFFGEAASVSDRDISPLVEATMDTQNPRDWFNALMDYGAMIAKTHHNPNRKSRHYTKQSAFEGSDRQIRGAVLRALAEHEHLPDGRLVELTGCPDGERIKGILQRMFKEGLIEHSDGAVRFPRQTAAGGSS